MKLWLVFILLHLPLESAVLPEYRSEHIGHEMLAAIKHYAKQVGWKRIELCTPPVPEFDQTVSFYQANGFDRTGGYKMRCLIQSL
ncbi:GNAT family N-acetyltransferase [Acinetobacter thermotolerans]|uniref:GNAT family N-acetyltransferase n=2 Tax=Acinetobacter thermotolerans TaxID=3151487 RepID=UPI00325BC141